MDKDRRTVTETFAFGYVGSPAEAVYPQWEYVRRYMEEGPEAVPASQVHLPIDGRREGSWWGAHMLLNVAPGHWLASLLLLPLLTPAVCMRWLCMLSNRVPRWPAVGRVFPGTARATRQRLVFTRPVEKHWGEVCWYCAPLRIR